MIAIHHYDQSYIRIDCDTGPAYELNDHFAFDAPNKQFDPRYKAKYWDGKIRLFNLMTKLIYRGLLPQVLEFLDYRQYEYSVDPQLRPIVEERDLTGLNITLRDYQEEVFTRLLEDNRGIGLVPTGGGKTPIIAALGAHHTNKGRRILVIVTGIQLAYQTADKFAEYGVNRTISLVGDQTFNDSGDIVVGVWKTVAAQSDKWLNQFNVVIGDEIHQFAAKTLSNVMAKLSSIRYRYGFTATLSNNQQSADMTLIGLFGPPVNPVTTADLVEQGHLARLKVNALILNHPKQDRIKYGSLSALSTPREQFALVLSTVVHSPLRNQYIVNLCREISGNTLILVRLRDHVKVLEHALTATTGKKVYVVTGSTKGKQRVKNTLDFASESNQIMLATYKTFQEGIDVPMIDNLILGSPNSSKIRTLQSIGRILRVTDDKITATLYDFVDIIPAAEKYQFLKRQFNTRLEMYRAEQHRVRSFEIDL